MVNRIKGRDAVYLARQLGIMATHANDRIGQKLAAVRSQASAVVTTLGVLKTSSPPLDNEKWDVTYAFPNKRSDILIPIMAIHLHKSTKVLLDFEDTNTFKAVLDSLCSGRDFLAKASTTDAQSNHWRLSKTGFALTDGGSSKND